MAINATHLSMLTFLQNSACMWTCTHWSYTLEIYICWEHLYDTKNKLYNNIVMFYIAL